MNKKVLFGILATAVFFSCCFHQAEGTFKLLKLAKAGLLLKALSPKKIILPLPIPIPIGIHQHNSYGHSDSHHGGYGHGGYGQGGYGQGGYGHGGYGHGGYGHGGYGHGGYGHGGYGHGGYGHGYDYGHHGHYPIDYKTTGYHIQTGFW